MGRNRKVIPAPIMTCVKCGHPKRLEDFRETRPGFYDSSCKECRKAHCREYMRNYSKKHKRHNPVVKIAHGEYDFVFNPKIKYG